MYARKISKNFLKTFDKKLEKYFVGKIKKNRKYKGRFIITCKYIINYTNYIRI